MSIRTWSLTRYWAMSGLSWLLAFVLFAVLGGLDDPAGPIGPVVVLIAAFAPAFWAGAWAGSHPEIGLWHAGRILVMWVLGFGAVSLVAGPLEAVGGFVVGAVAAPLVVLTWGWREQRAVARLRDAVTPSIRATRTDTFE